MALSGDGSEFQEFVSILRSRRPSRPSNCSTLNAEARVGRYTLSAAGFVKVWTDEYFGGRRLQVLDRLGSNREGGKDYFPYGEERSATANPADKFATYERDATGLDYADQRYYLSSAGRFATR